MFRITAGFLHSERAIERLQRLNAALNQQQALPQISQVMSTAIEQNYAAQGRDPAWPARKYVYPWPILWRTGNKRGIELQSCDRPWVAIKNGWRLAIYSAAYCIYHQDYDTQKQRGSLPPRVAVKLTDAERAEIMRILRAVFLAAGQGQANIT
jgi:phage gpG-like protein